MRIQLHHDSQWVRNGDTMVAGSAFVDGEQLSAEDLADRVSKTESEDELRRVLSRGNGFFSVIHQTEAATFAAVDHVRSWPLYYAVTDDVYVSDSAEWVHDAGASRGYDPIAATEYLFCCFVSGKDTLSRDVKQLRAGELVRFDDSEPGVQSGRYFVHSPTESTTSIDMDELDEVVEGAVGRLIDRADGRTILLGLSGGYDSRIIALMLHRLGYENVVAYTTQAAASGSENVETARSLADDLDFEHITVTSGAADYGRIDGSAQMKLVEDIGYLSEYPSINKVIQRRKLEAGGIDPEEVVHVLGHQLLGAGTFLPAWVREQHTLSRAEFTDLLWSLHYSHWEASSRTQWRELFESRMVDQIPASLYHSGTVEPTPAAMRGIEQWYWQERLPKFITIRREYEYLGFDMWYPLLDKELFSFFQRSDHRDRVEKRALKEYAARLDREVRGVRLRDELGGDGSSQSPANLLWNQIVRLVHALPDPATEAIRRRYNEYRSQDLYHTDPRYRIVSEETFDSFSFANVDDNALHRTLLYLYLYENGYFTLPGSTELDRAVGRAGKSG
ncbi:hypothetical protein GRX03_15650 [Halovenus sp. WSH3]|uniref:NAD/GMP synthase domain-containing protein n=1 Tax=Halovenus carboxidivorans TaxID=2692199 RepID=A0A6B0TCA7_9EURY|nr:asparagine synthase-related protein [Halovenus carboxidivorans]MXR53032.1 hypothetical protein [Halovenus carboxidivorans]